MGFETSLREELHTISGLENRVFPINAPENFPAPYIAYVSSEGVFDKTLDGFLSSKRIHAEINLICSTYESLKTISPEVVQRLQSFLRRMIGTSAPVFVKDITFATDEPIEIYEQEIKAYRAVFEITIQT